MGIRDQELVQEISTSKYLFQKAGSFDSALPFSVSTCYDSDMKIINSKLVSTAIRHFESGSELMISNCY